MIAHKLDVIYRDYLCNTINSETAIKDIIGLLDAFEYVSEVEYNRKHFAELVKKGVRHIIRIDASSIQAYKFLESCVINNTLDINARYELFAILEQRFPKKVQGIREYLLKHASGYFPDNITHNANIINAGLSRFIFKCYKILSSYGEFTFNYNFNGFSCGDCLIVNIKHDIYKGERYNAIFPYAQRLNWKIEGIGSSYYLIDDKYRIGLKDLIFSVNLLKKLDTKFNEDKLSINFHNSDGIPIRIDYKGSNIRIYFFS